MAPSRSLEGVCRTAVMLWGLCVARAAGWRTRPLPQAGPAAARSPCPTTARRRLLFPDSSPPITRTFAGHISNQLHADRCQHYPLTREPRLGTKGSDGRRREHFQLKTSFRASRRGSIFCLQGNTSHPHAILLFERDSQILHSLQSAGCSWQPPALKWTTVLISTSLRSTWQN